MARSWKEKLEETGQKIAEKTSEAGHRASESVEEAADWTKEKMHQAGHRIEEAVEKVEGRVKSAVDRGREAVVDTAGIRNHMEVYGACGKRVGTVDRVEGANLKLTKDDAPDGRHHLIPLAWVAEVQDRVVLTKNCDEVQREWTAE